MIVVLPVVPGATAALYGFTPTGPPYPQALIAVSSGIGTADAAAICAIQASVGIQPYSFPAPLTCSGPGAVCSLKIYQDDTETLAVDNRTPSLQVYLFGELLARFYSSVALLIWQVRFIPIYAFMAVCTLIIGNFARQNLAALGVASDPVYMTFQPVYSFALNDIKNVQGKEPGCRSLILLLLDTRYDGYEHDQGPDDDVSGTCGSESHDVNTAASETSALTVTSSGTSHSDLDLGTTTTLSVDPASVPLPCAEDDELELAEDVATLPTLPTHNASIRPSNSCPTHHVATMDPGFGLSCGPFDKLSCAMDLIILVRR
ncbi:hypothetical protein FS749_005031 [Ceratobasidium sp. UAMH 11750]|nr:hypothetical protein FS749_005031 [Ceratobasidium sp. UAMH 11750]